LRRRSRLAKAVRRFAPVEKARSQQNRVSLGSASSQMPDFRVILTGPSYREPRFYGELSWRATDVYVRQPHGGKDSRHSNGETYLSSEGTERIIETRLPLSAVTDEHLTTIRLPSLMTEPRVLDGSIRPRDLVVDTASLGTAPQLAVTIVSNPHLADALANWQTRSGISSVQTWVDKGLGQSLLVALLPNP